MRARSGLDPGSVWAQRLGQLERRLRVSPAPVGRGRWGGGRAGLPRPRRGGTGGGGAAGRGSAPQPAEGGGTARPAPFPQKSVSRLKMQARILKAAASGALDRSPVWGESAPPGLGGGGGGVVEL